MKPEPFVYYKHYEEIRRWWQGWKWEPVPLESLPENGVIIPGFAVGFLYKTDSNIAWLEWIVANPEADKSQRRQAVEIVIEYLTGKAKELGFKRVFTTTVHPTLKRMFGQRKYIQTDDKVSHFLRRFD